VKGKEAVAMDTTDGLSWSILGKNSRSHEMDFLKSTKIDRPRPQKRDAIGFKIFRGSFYNLILKNISSLRNYAYVYPPFF
jgi:hypothetical protein